MTKEEKLIKDVLTGQAHTLEEMKKLTGIKQIRLIELLSVMEFKGEIKAVREADLQLDRAGCDSKF